MGRIVTEVGVPQTLIPGLIEHGRLSYEVACARYKRYYERELRQAHAALQALAEGRVRVFQHTNVHRARNEVEIFPTKGADHAA